jgi:acetoacetyl-CoA synthetase
VPGDRVVGYLPNTLEAIVGLLATAAIGAVWASCGQDYAPAAVLDRFAQLQPKVLLTADAHRFGGRLHDSRAAIGVLREGLPTLAATIVVERLAEPAVADTIPWSEATAGNAPLETVPVPFDHPLWILFSSGTTGKPKGIVHGHGGVLLEHLKAVRLQLDVGPGDRYLWYTTPSWMVWNLQASVLLAGATVVCYEGSPVRPTADVLWSAAARCRVTFLGTSPGQLTASEKAGLRPGAEHDLSALRILASTGSALPAAAFTWAAENVGAHVQVMSITGGTDVVSGFAGGSRTVPVWPGELSVPWLGVALDAWDDAGDSMWDEVGELVVTRPMPSMPVGFWKDPDGSRYREAYFERYPGVWRHGDWITVTRRGSVLVHGRSDSTLNRNGVRMGSADIYQVVEALPEIGEALVIGAEQADGGYWMPLFVTLAPGYLLDEDLRVRIKAVIRDQVSARHVPDEIIEAPGVEGPRVFRTGI